MEWLTKIFEAIKLPTSAVVVVFMVSAFLLLLPESCLDALKVLAIKQKYSEYIGMAVLFSLVVLAIRICIWMWNEIKNRQWRKESKEQSVLKLNRLDHAEQSVLREFVIQGQNTIELPVSDPVVAGLLQIGILQSVGSLGHYSGVGLLRNVRIAPHLQITKEMLQVPDSSDDAAVIKWLQENRPNFMRTLERYYLKF